MMVRKLNWLELNAEFTLAVLYIYTTVPLLYVLCDSHNLLKQSFSIVTNEKLKALKTTEVTRVLYRFPILRI